VADFGRFGLWSPAAQMAGTPRGAGISGKKKGPETIRTLQFGGGGRNWTAVRRHSIPGTTCLSRRWVSSCSSTVGQAHRRTSLF